MRVSEAAELVSAAIDAAAREGPALVLDFYRPLNESTRAALTPIEAVDLLFDWERLREEVLAPLVRGEEARYRRYDWKAERLGEDVATVEARGVVVVEGAYVARPALRGYYDLIVAVESPRDLCIARQLQRGEDEPEQIARWRAAEDWYLERQDPGRNADLVIDGSGDAE